MKNTVHCKGIIFDLDGTLVDSSSIIEKIWKTWCNNYNIDFDKLISVSHGRPTIETMKEFLPTATKEMTDWFLEQEMNETEGLIQIKGADDFIRKLPYKKWAIATSGVMPLASARVKAAGLPLPFVFITADKISKGKPDPESFLKAAEQLGIAPSDCVVFEDSKPGVLGAIRAGCKVIGIKTSLSDIPEAEFAVSSFDELDVKVLEKNNLLIRTTTKTI